MSFVFDFMCYICIYNDAMDNKTDEIKQEKLKTPGVGVPYPVETLNEILETAKYLVDEYGSSRPISKEEISKTLKKSVNTLTLFFSTLGQYGLFTLVHGKGYLPSDLYRKYTEPIHDNDEQRAKLQMFRSVPLYAKIIEHLNGHQLPADEKRFANLLKGEPYNVNPNSSDKAAKVFFENCRDLGFRDPSGKFRFPDINGITSSSGREKVQVSEPVANTVVVQAPPQDDLFELPIPLPNRRKAYLRYPLENLTKKDINVITKALEFIASSLDDE
jgi:hypothetical protein